MGIFEKGQYDRPEIKVAEWREVRREQRGVEDVCLERSLEMGPLVGLLGLFFGTGVCCDERLLWIDAEPTVGLKLNEPEIPRNNRRPFLEIRLVVAPSR